MRRWKTRKTACLGIRRKAAKVSDWFVKEESRNAEWSERTLPCLPEPEKAGILGSLIIDNASLNGASAYGADDGSVYLDAYLSGDGLHLGIEKGSDDYNRLLPLFRQGQAETLSRTIDRIQGESLKAYNPQFAGYYANTILPPTPRQTVAFGKFLDDFMDFQRRAYPKTPRTHYVLPIRILREVIGENTPLNTVSRHHLEKVFDVLCSIPCRMTQRYPGLTAEKAIEAAARDKDTCKLAPRTLQNDYISISAVFNFAVDEQLISENPAKGRKNAERFKTKRKKTPRPPFTPEELQKIFQAPLYTGCENDERGYAKPGTETPRRGRFWVPLLALFHGVRCNEACQLYAEDIGEEKGIPYLHVRDDLDDEEETDKRLKNEGSRRKVPIHPELLKMGFMEYVQIRRNQDGGRLFPTLNACKTTGRFSKPFSQWFGRFITRACGYKPKAVFHSFRHNFREQLTIGGVQTEYVEALGGWTPEGSSEIEYRHAGLPELRRAIEKVTYPGLNLSHLYAPVNAIGCKDTGQPGPTFRTRKRPSPVPPLHPGAE